MNYKDKNCMTLCSVISFATMGSNAMCTSFEHTFPFFSNNKTSEKRDSRIKTAVLDIKETYS
jgi:L-ribulose-5-phosphate 3-epimerase UlaE